MKKVLLLSIVFLLSVTVFGQTEKGKFFVSGGTGLQFTSGTMKTVYGGETDYKVNQSTFTLLPSFGYFIVDNLALGLAGNITSSSQKDEDDDKYTTTSTLLMPCLIYFFPVEGNVKPLLQVGAGYNQMTSKESWEDDEEKVSAGGIAFNFGGGIAYFISQNICMNFGLSYTISNLKNKDNDEVKMKSGMFGGNIGFSIFF